MKCVFHFPGSEGERVLVTLYPSSPCSAFHRDSRPHSFPPSSLPARTLPLSPLSSWLNNIIDIILHDVERPKEDDANEPGKEQLNPFFWPRLETWPHGASASVALARQRSIHIKQFVFSIRDCPLHFEYPTIIHGLVKDSAALCVPCSTSFWHTNRSHTT